MGCSSLSHTRLKSVIINRFRRFPYFLTFLSDFCVCLLPVTPRVVSQFRLQEKLMCEFNLQLFGLQYSKRSRGRISAPGSADIRGPGLHVTSGPGDVRASVCVLLFPQALRPEVISQLGTRQFPIPFPHL